MHRFLLPTLFCHATRYTRGYVGDARKMKNVNSPSDKLLCNRYILLLTGNSQRKRCVLQYAISGANNLRRIQTGNYGTEANIIVQRSHLVLSTS
jgi:hypothetical protein